MSSIQPCRDLSDTVELCASLGLFMKSIARLNISIQLPQLKTPGKSISNWEVMEKLRQAIKPIEFTQLKISKTTLEFIRFEGEVENRSALKTVIFRLDNSTLKLTGFPDNLRVRAAEAKVVFPTRHDWDSYFRDAKHMDEMKPGERPDTVYVQGLPCKWFARTDKEGDRPSEDAVKQAFSSPGQVRCVDIPLLDPYQKDSNATVGKISTFSFSQDFTFDAYIQYQEYIGFMKAMDSLRGMKLVYKAPDGRAFAANIKVDFDKSKHLSEENKKKRELERAKLQSLEKEREERVLRERQEEERQREAERKRLQEEEEERGRRKEEKQRRREERKRKEEAERKRREEGEERRKREEEEKKRKVEEERKRKEEEERKRRAEEERRRAEEERRRVEEEERRKEEERKRKEEEELRSIQEEEARRQQRWREEQELKRKMAEAEEKRAEAKRKLRERRNKEERKRKEEEAPKRKSQEEDSKKSGKKKKEEEEEEEYARRRRGAREDWEEWEEEERRKWKAKQKEEERLRREEEEARRRKEERLKEQRLAEGTRKAQASQLLYELFQLLKEEKHKESEAVPDESRTEERELRDKLLRQEQLLRERLLRNLEARKREKAAEALRTRAGDPSCPAPPLQRR